jgi:rhodanese-related sulfurtransferase
MTQINTLVAFVGWGLALGLWWYVRRLHREVQGIKREWYDCQQALKKVPQEIQSAVEPLRMQMSALAEGKSVSPALIRSGRLYQELSALEASELLHSPEAPSKTVLLDVRSPSEFAKRRIPGAVLIPVEQLDARFQAELSSTARVIVVYCGQGDRSRLACEFLSRQGWTNIAILRGGIGSWPGPFDGDMGSGLIQILSKSRGSLNSMVF